MDKNARRFTIYVPRELSAQLAVLREEVYRDCSQQEMLRDLIARGLQEREKRTREAG